MLTNTNEFYNILRAIVIHSKPDPCNRLNMFAVMDDRNKLNQSDAGMTMSHYDKGLFWARDWVNKGRSPNDICREYDALIVDPPREATMKSPGEKSYTVMFDFAIVGQVKCESCPSSCMDTVEGKRGQLIAKMHEVLRELGSYQLYNVIPVSGSAYTAWLSEGQAAHMTTQTAIYSSVTPRGKMLSASFMAGASPIYQPSWNNLSRSQAKLLGVDGKTSLIDNVVAIATSLAVTFCNPNPSISYVYENPSSAALGLVKCEYC